MTFKEWMDKRRKGEKKHVGVVTIPQDLTVPEGWFVLEMGQSPAHLLWFCHLVNIDDAFGGNGKSNNPRRVWTEEHDTAIQALQECIQLINKETQNETMDGKS